MKTKLFKFSQIFIFVSFFTACTAQFPQTELSQSMVTSQQEFNEAVKNAEPGDTIVMQNGVWNDFEMIFEAKGTKDKPVTLTVQDKGKVIISGQSNLRLAGEHLVVSGLVFKNGYTPTKEVISFRRSKDKLANNTRVTEVVIDHFNNPERFERDFWVMMYGKNNRFDHNHLEGKSNAGVTMAVRLNTEASQNNHHRIDHNYFGPRQTLGSNGGETLRIGTSHYSLTDSYTTVENNYFDRCNGEVEIISSKSGRNTLRGNVFFESQGTLTLRHGNDNLIENNVFLGNGIAHTGGFRVINKRQTIRNNYMYGLRGYRFGGALVVMNGVPNSPINRYHQVEDSVVENNSIIDSDHIEFGAGADSERSAPPITSTFKNNLVVNREAKDSIGVHDDISGITFEGNVASGVTKLPSKTGFEEKSINLVKAANGLEYPSDANLSGIGISKSLEILDKNITGPTWYVKPDNASRFSGGKTIKVKAGEDTLTQAVAKSSPGDVLELAAGNYSVSKIIQLPHAVTVQGSGSDKTLIKYDRTTLFEITDGGSLKIASLTVDGADAPDAYGNSVVRTTRYSMLSNYELVVKDSKFIDLDKNHSFNFLKVASHTFADNISIENSEFKDVSGHVIALEREIDDLGIYNGEYITVKNSHFENIGKTVANIYRGGTDESTFGPHFTFSQNTILNAGKNKRNKSKASIFLQGVQVATLIDNKLNDSTPIQIVETVGDPITTMAQNTLVSTPETSIKAFVK
jgi:poly(beta-D-mannuronate) lyase